MQFFIAALPSFNPRSHAGSDKIDNIVIVEPVPFKSTLPRGERHAVGFSAANRKVFQSTLPRGERLRAAWRCGASGGFQSTLPRGERLLSNS